MSGRHRVPEPDQVVSRAVVARDVRAYVEAGWPALDAFRLVAMPLLDALVEGAVEGLSEP